MSFHDGKPRYAFYSIEADRSDLPLNVYRTVDGREVLVTGIGLDPECSAYGYTDKQLLGEVTEWVRCERRPAFGGFMRSRWG